eukprot:Skav201118  [mRNA]  locus=scaffold185:441667:447862:+ [translate_table: standard]
MPWAKLEYQKVIPGKRIGRYISSESTHGYELCDIPDETEVEIQNARLVDELCWKNAGFELLHGPTQILGCFSVVYYAEAEQLIKEALEKSGSQVEKVMVFDHTTIRCSTSSQLNTLGAKSATAGPVTRVHVDYNEESAPKRLQQLVERPGYTGIQLRSEEVHRVPWAVRHVWQTTIRSQDPDHPVLQRPLSLCDPRSIDEKDWISYEMIYPDRVGSRFALSNANAASHKWYYYPEMKMEECLLFTCCYDRRRDVPRFVFHCAFDSGSSEIPRQSIEVRAITIFNEPT